MKIDVDGKIVSLALTFGWNKPTYHPNTYLELRVLDDRCLAFEGVKVLVEWIYGLFDVIVG